ncbi:ANTAR domain-containing protein [Arthrobacter sp. TB 23]|uniref:ANTAR domain-containing protein n=1 Tax=Arthrobacter sp. TB 23 TaxID=494419 RepID=UPI0012EA50B4|nr:ANTAR domain-containing protein [Arthrobacter sp. TB 23]
MDGRGDGAMTAQLQQMVLRSESMDSFLAAFTAYTSTLFEPDITVLCGITLTGEDLALTEGSSPEAIELEKLQHSIADNPWPTETRTGTVQMIVVHNTGADTPWPAYREALKGRSIASVLRTQILISAGRQAGIGVYARRPNVFTPDMIDRFQGYATDAAISCELALKLGSYRDATADLHAAMESRTNIDIAVGIIIGQNHCTQAEAVQVLRRASSQQHLKLRALAEEIVQSINAEPASTHFVPAPGQKGR